MNANPTTTNVTPINTRTSTPRKAQPSDKAKPAIKPRSPRKAKPKADLSVMGQIRTSLMRENLSATAMGFLLGGLVPLSTYMIVHYQIRGDVAWYLQPLLLMVLGGLVFSAKTVYEWTAQAFNSRAKALGFVVLVEGILTLSSQEWLAITALAYLIAVNGIATGVRLALSRKE
jgi:hypothetical protein